MSKQRPRGGRPRGDDDQDEAPDAHLGHASSESGGVHARGLYIPDLSVRTGWDWHTVCDTEMSDRKIGFFRR